MSVYKPKGGTFIYSKRKIENAIREVAGSFTCVVIYGSRQVGKSSIWRYDKKVTLDDGNNRVLAKQNPKLFLETHGWPLIIDEIQKAPELLDEIKIVIDDKKLEWTENDEDQQLMSCSVRKHSFFSDKY